MSEHNSAEWTRTIVWPALDGLELVEARFSTHRFPLHAHAEMVIGAVLRGAKRSRVGLKDMEIGPGMLTLFNPYEEHTSVGITGNWTFVGVYPAPSLVARLFGDGQTDARRIRLSTAICRDALGADRLVKLVRALSGAPSSLEAETEVFECLAYFLGRHGTLSSESREAPEPGVRRARDRLDGDLSGEVGLGELSAIAELPRLKLLRGFRRALGCTPHVYSTTQRIAAAKGALVRGESIADVAVRFGFCDQSHFTRVFRRWTGSSPGRFAAAAA
jgi:AraC-like DNA-binding protein